MRYVYIVCLAFLLSSCGKESNSNKHEIEVVKKIERKKLTEEINSVLEKIFINVDDNISSDLLSQNGRINNFDRTFSVYGEYQLTTPSAGIVEKIQSNINNIKDEKKWRRFSSKLQDHNFRLVFETKETVCFIDINVYENGSILLGCKSVRVN